MFAHALPDLGPIGSYRRVSTKNQLDNDRYLRAFQDMAEVIEGQGGTPVPYDEGGHARSGATIRGRKVFKAMLADVATGELRGIGAPDVRSLSRGEWLIDGKTIADTLIKAGATLITRSYTYNLRNPRDLHMFQDELIFAMRERDHIRQRMYEGQAARGRNAVEGKDRPWGRHRTMLGYHLEVLKDARGEPRITARGQVKRGIAKDPNQAAAMLRLMQEMDRQPNRAALFAALEAANIKGPEPGSGRGGWNKRGLDTLLDSQLHRGNWALVRDPKSNVWYGLDPRSPAEFDVSKVARDYADLRYWSERQVLVWRSKFLTDDQTRRAKQERQQYSHPLLGLLCCPQCHRPLVGKGKLGYICPIGAKGKRAVDEKCLPIFTIRESSAFGGLEAVMPLLKPRLADLTEQAREALKRRNDGSADIHLAALANEERMILKQTQALAAKGLEAPESHTDRLVEIAQEKRRIQAEQDAAEQVSEARVRAERAFADLRADEVEVALGKLDPLALAEFYRAFLAWVEVRPNGPGRMGGQLVDYLFHNEQTASGLSVMERLVTLFAVGA